MRKRHTVATLVLLLALGSAALPAQAVRAAPAPKAAPGPTVGLGLALRPEELAPYDLTVFPDGRKLPPGRGSVGPRSRLVRRPLCRLPWSARHRGAGGPFWWAVMGSSPGTTLLRPLRINQYPLLVQSVGARWAYATTVFDYIRRAMPQHAPQKPGCRCLLRPHRPPDAPQRTAQGPTRYWTRKACPRVGDARCRQDGGRRTQSVSEALLSLANSPRRARIRDSDTLEMPR